MADEKGGWEASEISTFAITSSLFSFQGLSWPTSSWLREPDERTQPPTTKPPLPPPKEEVEEGREGYQQELSANALL